METRSLQITGGSSYTISLPKKWVSENNLKEKDSIEIYSVSRNRLLIQKSSINFRRKPSIEITNLTNEHFKRELLAHYISGVDEILIKNGLITYEQRNMVRRVGQRLLGFESFEINSREILFKNISSSNIPTEELLQKMVEVIILMHSDLGKVFENKNLDLAKDIIARDDEIDKIHTAISRQLNRMLYNPSPGDSQNTNIIDLHYYSHVALRLERLADHVVRICKTISMSESSRNFFLTRPEMLDYLKTGKYLLSCKNIILNKNKRDANILLDLLQMKKKGTYLNKTIKNKKSINILVEDSTDRIKSYIKNIAEDTINYLIFIENIT